MISIVICSRTKILDKNLQSNIHDTIGVDYELIIIDNSENRYTIFEAYNKGIEKSEGEIILFLHDDILFKSINWGETLEKIFKLDSDFGLVGIAGSKIKTKMPSPWWYGTVHIRIIQHHRQGWPSENKNIGFDDKDLVEVAVIDGVFMAAKNHSEIRFNENLLGFHNYDLDLSLKMKELGKKVLVTNQIEIEHFSSGYLNKDWYISASKFHQVYSNRLPLIVKNSIDNKDYKVKEFQNGARFIKELLNHNLRCEAYYWWVKLLGLKLFSKFHLRFVKKLLYEKGA